jgi:hypothetical protein
MKKKTRMVNLLMITALFLGACNLPSADSANNSDIVGTAAAQTLSAVLSATPLSGMENTSTFTPLPLAATSTPIPLPVNTNTPVPTATSNCNKMQFIADVTIPDGTVMTPGLNFTKTWRIKNVGTCTWTPSYAIIFSSGNSMNGPATQALVGNVNPGQSIDIPVNLTAPATPGDYTAYWKLRDGSGILFDQFYVQIKVQNAVTATFTLPPAIVFAVTSVTYSVSAWSSGGNVNCPRITANITANGAGTITYTWTSTSGTNSPQTLVFGSAGTQSINYDWARGSVWAGTPDSVGIYINTPNHQDFGSQTFTTACTTP